MSTNSEELERIFKFYFLICDLVRNKNNESSSKAKALFINFNLKDTAEITRSSELIMLEKLIGGLVSLKLLLRKI